MLTPCDMQSFIVWMMAGIAEGGGTQGDDADEAVEGAKGNGNNFGIFRCAAHEDGAKEVFCMPAICHGHDKVRLGIGILAGISHRNRLKTGTTTVTTTMLV
jgi:hypothetical protein